MPLKDLFFRNRDTTAERITQKIDHCKFTLQNKYSTLQRMDDYYSSCEKKRNI